MKQKFYICEKCKNVISKISDSGMPVICCGEGMSQLVPGAVNASREKHTPVYKLEGNIVTVNVGSIEHPMEPEHYIEWICLQTSNSSQIVYLQPEQKPEAQFALCKGDEVEEVFAYCKNHGLWSLR